jgi:hypothetical protein
MTQSLVPSFYAQKIKIRADIHKNKITQLP